MADFVNQLEQTRFDLSGPGNYLLSGSHTGVKAMLLVATGIFAGYTLEPVPSLFREHFSKNPLVKWLNLFIIGILLSDFVNNKISAREVLVAAVVAALIIVAFEWLRYYNGETSGNWVAQNVFPHGNRSLLQ